MKTVSNIREVVVCGATCVAVSPRGKSLHPAYEDEFSLSIRALFTLQLCATLFARLRRGMPELAKSATVE